MFYSDRRGECFYGNTNMSFVGGESRGESLVASRQLSLSLLSSSGIAPKKRKRKIYRAACQRSSPSTTASIPSKYRTYFTPYNERKGFNCQSTRFVPETDDHPGPGHYPFLHSTMTVPEESLSKRGTGGFASRAKRFSKTRSLDSSMILGPGAYNPVIPSRRIDFNRTDASRTFHTSVLTEDPLTPRPVANTGPGPNTYHVSDTPIKTSKLITGEAVFKSRTERGDWTKKAPNPGPGDYSPYELVPTSGRKTANFQSKTKRDLLTLKGTGIDNPGPGHYFKTASNKTKYNLIPYHKQKHYLCISAPAIPLPPLPPLPGPGHYEVATSGSTEDTQLVGGAVFKSNSSRWKGEDPLVHQPGPGDYDPKAPGKQSFLYNWTHKWI